ncbi:MAG: NYN domain-containing protein, partial [Hyphomicrobiaceae bacterium]
GADIRMAMDIIEATYIHSEIDEYILLTSDSDFVPVLERLRQKGKRSVIVASEHKPNIHTTYSHHADLLIPSRGLNEATKYTNQKRAFAGWFRRGRGRDAQLSLTALATDQPAANAAAADQTGKAKPATNESCFESAIESALRRVVKLLREQPRNFVAQRRILAELSRIQGFKRRGDTAFLGFHSYRSMMLELARRDEHIKVVDQPGGGTGVYYQPEEAETQPAAEPANGKTPPPLPVGAAEPHRNGGNGETLAEALATRVPTTKINKTTPPPVKPVKPRHTQDDDDIAEAARNFWSSRRPDDVASTKPAS